MCNVTRVNLISIFLIRVTQKKRCDNSIDRKLLWIDTWAIPIGFAAVHAYFFCVVVCAFWILWKRLGFADRNMFIFRILFWKWPTFHEHFSPSTVIPMGFEFYCLGHFTCKCRSIIYTKYGSLSSGFSIDKNQTEFEIKTRQNGIPHNIMRFRRHFLWYFFWDGVFFCLGIFFVLTKRLNIDSLFLLVLRKKTIFFEENCSILYTDRSYHWNCCLYYW